MRINILVFIFFMVITVVVVVVVVVTSGGRLDYGSGGGSDTGSRLADMALTVVLASNVSTWVDNGDRRRERTWSPWGSQP